MRRLKTVLLRLVLLPLPHQMLVLTKMLLVWL